MKLKFVVIAITTISLFCLGTASAQKAKYIPDQPTATEKQVNGWDGKLTLGASVSLSQSSNFVGQIDGTAFSLGFNVDSALKYLKNEHEWRNSLTLADMFTLTPVVDSFVKTNDILALESIYLYHIKAIPWFGPFFRLQFDTAIFPGEDVRAAAVDYQITALNGNVNTQNAAKLHLTDSFSPLTLRETLGLFAKPIAKKTIAVEFKAGFLARQTFAKNQRAVDDDSKTAQIEIITLDNVIQGGPSAGVIVDGSLVEDRLLYKVLGEAMIPVVTNQGETDNRSAGELTNVNLAAHLSVKIFSWASLDYQFRAVREPQLIDKFQIQNNLLLTFSYSLIKSKADSK
ncbi:MAG: hypothetical protein V1754_05645 [Pseudomonadota bacterium]